MLHAWAMKFNRKYVGGVCVVLGGDGPPIVNAPGQKSLFSLISLSEKSERDLPASERETVGESLTGLLQIA